MRCSLVWQHRCHKMKTAEKDDDFSGFEFLQRHVCVVSATNCACSSRVLLVCWLCCP
jgi:hypothetical protein